MAALANHEVEERELSGVQTVVSELVQRAQSLEVRTADEANAATEFLAQLARQKKQSESARTALVKPLNDHVKGINARFAEVTAPLQEADGIVRGKVLAFRQEEQRRIDEENRRLEAERQARIREEEERRRREAAAAEEARAAAAREATRKEAEAKAAARELDAALAEKSEHDLKAIIVDEGGSDAAARAQEELKRRAAAKEADAALARVQALEAEAAHRAEQVKTTPIELPPPAAVVAPSGLKSQSGSASTRKVWKFELDDETRVPRQYLQVDEVLIRKAIREGVREIPGVRIYQDDQLAVKA